MHLSVQFAGLLPAMLIYAFLGACLGALLCTGKRVYSAIVLSLLFGVLGALLIATS
jgi:hypothetical protein